MTDAELILIAGLLLAAGLVAAKAADRVRVPGLLLFLGLGMLIGSEGIGGVEFDDAELARTLGTIGLVLILFEGGLTAGWGEIRPVLGTAISLATIGTVVTAVITGLAAVWLFDLTTLEGLLIGSAVAATDSAAIFAVLRGSHLRKRLARALEGESGMNDPVALLLVTGFIDWIELPGLRRRRHGRRASSLKLAIGAAFGVAIGFAARWAIRNLDLPTPGLYPVASIAAAALAYGVARARPRLRLPLRLHRRADPRHRPGAGAPDDDRLPPGALLGRADLALLPARPARLPQRAGRRRRRGPAALGRPDLRRPPAGDARGERVRAVRRARAGDAELGRAARGDPDLARDLPRGRGRRGQRADLQLDLLRRRHLDPDPGGDVRAAREAARAWSATRPALTPPLIETGIIRELGGESFVWRVRPATRPSGHPIKELELPREALVNLIVRDGAALPPRGSTEIEAGDELHIVARLEALDEVQQLAARWREARSASPPFLRCPRTARPRCSRSGRGTTSRDGDPGAPETIDGVAVAQRLRTRRDGSGSLVVLADGRYAVTSAKLLAVGGRRRLAEWCARRVAAPGPTQAERAWWQELAGALSAPATPPDTDVS